MRYRDRAANHERDIEGVHELFARDSAIRALLDVISNAIVAAQNNRGRQAHQLLRFLIERASFVSLCVEREKSFDAEVAAPEQLLVHFGAIEIKLVHHRNPFNVGCAALGYCNLPHARARARTWLHAWPSERLTASPDPCSDRRTTAQLNA